MATNIYFLRLLARQERLQLIGHLGACMDVLVVSLTPVLFYSVDCHVGGDVERAVRAR